MNSSIKGRLAALQELAAQKQDGVAIMSLLENGEWAACRGPQSPTKTFKTQSAAREYLTGCNCVIVIDV